RVFISCARADLPRVRPIVDHLAKAGSDAFIAQDQSLSDSADALGSVDYLVVFISFASIESEWVKSETDAMLGRRNETGDNRVIPARLDRVPLELVSEFLLPLRGADFVESHDQGMAALLAELGVEPGRRADQVEPPAGSTLLEMLNSDDVALHGP